MEKRARTLIIIIMIVCLLSVLCLCACTKEEEPDVQPNQGEVEDPATNNPSKPEEPEKPEPEVFTVTFITDGQTYCTVDVISGETVKLPTDPEKQDYSFEGWYLEIGCVTAFDANEAVIKNMKLYARFLLLDPDATDTDIANFEASIEAFYGSIVSYEIIDGDFFLFTEKDGAYSFYRADIGEDAGLETVGQLENLKEDLNEIQNVFSIKTEKNYLEYDGMKYNLNAIKGKNIFAERAGKNAANSVTTVDLDVNGTEATMKIYVVTGNETKIATIKTSSSVAMTVEDALDQLLLEDFSEMTTETITSGIDATRIDSAEIPEEVILAPAELDYSALESKICAGVKKLERGYDVTNLLGYVVDENKDLLVLTELENKYSSRLVGLYKLEGDFSTETQKDIDSITSTISSLNFENIVSFTKAQSDVTIDGVTYSKSGIEGDNIFAQQCGVENAELTFFGDLQLETFATFSTGYGKGLELIILYHNDEGNFVLTTKRYLLESSSDHTREETYENMFTSEKRKEVESKTYDLGTLIGGSLVEKSELEEELVK